MTKYSVFISYRRTGFETANLIAEKLRSMGYSVFFDVESLRGGKFNEQLFQVIDGCTDFVLVLPKDALERCADKDDWVRKEVMYAMLKQKNIVPVMLNDFDWPDPMPSGMEELKDYQAVTASDRNTFDLAMQRLASYLKASKYKKILISKIVAIILTIVIVLGLIFAAMRLGSRPSCKLVGDYLATNTELIYEMYTTYVDMENEWDKFLRNYDRTTSTSRRLELKNDLQGKINVWNHNTNSVRQNILTPPKFTLIESMMLSTHGVIAWVLTTIPDYSASFCDDLDSISSQIQAIIEAPNIDEIRQKALTMNLDIYDHTTKAYYYAYLSEMSHLPSSSKIVHEQLKVTWKLFPNTPDGLSAAKYDEMQQWEMDRAEEIVHDYSIYLQTQENEMENLSDRMDSLMKMSHMIDAILTTGDIQIAENQKQQITQERIQTKRELVAQKKEELNEEQQKVLNIYNQVKSNCTLQESDSPGYQWGKIIRMAKMLANSVNSQQQALALNIAEGATIKPDMVYTDICSMLDDYVRFHSESLSYIEPLRLYYQLVSEGKQPLGGQLIFAFKDNATHPLFEIGDIVITRNGVQITNYASLIAAIKEDNRGYVEFYRMENHKLTLHKENFPETSVLVGYMEVGEY